MGEVHRRRRELRFADLSEVMVEVRGLIPSHQTIRNWTLAQVCRHLADTFHGSIDGFSLRRHRLKRWLFHRSLLRYTFRWGIPENYTVDPNLTPPPGVELEESLRSLEEAIARFRSHGGELKPHPLFGRLDRANWERLHLFHAAHHLGFVLPSEW